MSLPHARRARFSTGPGRAATSPGGTGHLDARHTDDEPDYPGPFAPTVGAAASALRGELGGLDDWSERYAYLIELGRQAPPLPAALRTEANRVHGCQSTVYLAARRAPDRRGTVAFLADSDSELVRGLLALLQHLFSGQPAADILTFDLPRFLAELGLDANLTAGRRNGLAGMIRRLRTVAAG